jgi:hypothetical protein
MKSQNALEAALYPLKNKLTEAVERRGNEWSSQQHRDEDHCNLRNKGQGHFLNLGYSLHKRNNNPRNHGQPDGRAAGDDNSPYRRADKIKSVNLIHGQPIVNPAPSTTFSPESRIADDAV